MLVVTTLLATSLLLTADGYTRALRRNTTSGFRIINGIDAPAGKYPSLVSVQVNGYHICGGTILNRDTVLTAAHCFANVRNKELISVVSSSVDLGKPCRKYKVSKVIRHKAYNPNDLLLNDIALIKVATPFTLQGDEKTVTISKKANGIHTGSWSTTVGWGYLQPGSGQNSVRLKEVEQQLLNYRACSARIGRIYPTQFCIVYPGNGKGICEGDSGGPIFHAGRQIGILSWRDGSAPCGQAPAVATLLSHYIDWLIKYA